MAFFMDLGADVNTLFDKFAKIYKRLINRNKAIVIDDMPSYYIDFVKNTSDLKGVYEVRDSIFGENEFTGNAYDFVYRIDPYALRILKNSEQEILGYYGLCRVDEQTFKKFREGKLTHRAILKNSIPITTQSDTCILYIAGMVVKKGFAFSKEHLASYLIADFLDYLNYFLENNDRFPTFKMMGYAVSKEGLHLFKLCKNIFIPTGQLIDNKALQEVFIFDKKNVKKMRLKHKRFTNRAFYSKYEEDVESTGWLDFEQDFDDVEGLNGRNNI